MAKTYKPPYVQSAKMDGVVSTSANTASDGSGSISTLCQVGSDDGTIKRIRAVPAQASRAAASAKVAALFWSANGYTWNALDEKAMATVTPSTTNPNTVGQAIFSFPDGLNLPASYYIGCIITVYAGVQDRVQWTVERADN